MKKKRIRKTPSSQLKAARKYYRTRHNIPEDAPLHSVRAPHRPRRGTGNERKIISMPVESWELLDDLRKEGQTRGEFVQDCLHTEAELAGYNRTE